MKSLEKKAADLQGVVWVAVIGLPRRFSGGARALKNIRPGDQPHDHGPLRGLGNC